MRANEIEPNTKVINLTGKLSHLDEVKNVNGTDCQDGVLEDETGQVKITLWGDQAGKFKQGDRVILITGWCKEFEGDLQVSTGKFGRIEKVPTTK